MTRNYCDEALAAAGIKLNGSGDHQRDQLEVVCMADVKPKPIDWLWKNWIAIGKVSVLAGEGGQGKSTVLCDIAARASSGEEWPDGETNGRQRGVLILAAEDDVEDTLAPRLITAGADMGLIHNIRSVRPEGRTRRSFNLQADLELLEREIERHDDIALVVMDPVTSYLGKVDSHKNADVRSVLEPLGELGARKRVALVCNNHFTKNTMGGANSRIIGSVAFVNQARAAFIITSDAEDKTRKLLIPSKTNICPERNGLAYRIESAFIEGAAGSEILTSRIQWESTPVTISANEALAALEGGDENRKAASEAEDFLREKLCGGPVPAKEGEEHARALGIAPATLKRARKKLGVVAEKAGLKEGWVWRLPARRGSPQAEGDQDSPGGNGDPLRDS